MRPETVVTYELEILTVDGERVEKFTKNYDTEIYEEDKDSTDWMAIDFKMKELEKFKYGKGIVLLEVSIERGVLQ